MITEEKKLTCPPKGTPKWMSTFADLMSLLMCFFVLLLSFSEMDVLKFKQIAGSMEYAFGVQNQVETYDIPKGTSVIANKFRPGKPEPTPLDIVTQYTNEITKPNLDTIISDTKDYEVDSINKANGNTGNFQLENEIKGILEVEIDTEIVEIETLGQQIIIRIEENGLFPQGSAYLQPAYRPLIRKIAMLIKEIPGIIHISGHTSDVVIDSELYRSSWDLSSLRAASVVLEMEKVKGFESERVIIQGMSRNNPVFDSSEYNLDNKNRRVEISILQGETYISDRIKTQNLNVN